MSKEIYKRTITCKNGKDGTGNCDNCIFAYAYDDCHIADILRPEGKEWDNTKIILSIRQKAKGGK